MDDDNTTKEFKFSWVGEEIPDSMNVHEGKMLHWAVMDLKFYFNFLSKIAILCLISQSLIRHTLHVDGFQLSKAFPLVVLHGDRVLVLWLKKEKIGFLDESSFLEDLTSGNEKKLGNICNAIGTWCTSFCTLLACEHWKCTWRWRKISYNNSPFSIVEDLIETSLTQSFTAEWQENSELAIYHVTILCR